jgi:hypothetical protein
MVAGVLIESRSGILGALSYDPLMTHRPSGLSQRGTYALNALSFTSHRPTGRARYLTGVRLTGPGRVCPLCPPL